MSKQRLHTHIIQHPFAPCLQGAMLDSYVERPGGLVLEYHALELDSAPEIYEQDGTLVERVRGRFVPVRLTFTGVTGLKGTGFLETLASLPPGSQKRTVATMLAWRQPERDDIFYITFLRAPEADDPEFFARRVAFERLPGPARPADFERDWSPAPPMPDRLVPRPRQLHLRFGGDPVTVTLAGQPRTRRLFIGGLETQSRRRPEVDAVLNLGEQASRWTDLESAHPADRWAHKGEGRDGMCLDEIRQEAGWVIEHLQAGLRVLVHCVAGMNRSVTVCCAVLILLEGLSAEQALARVCEHHPWARPDGNHWLKLKWLAANNSPRKT
jgi:hypothetical protein